jgi:hypothetical protein
METPPANAGYEQAQPGGAGLTGQLAALAAALFGGGLAIIRRVTV